MPQDMQEQVDMKVEPQCMELLMLVLVLRLRLGLGLALKVEEQNVYLLHRYFYPFCSSLLRHQHA